MQAPMARGMSQSVPTKEWTDNRLAIVDSAGVSTDIGQVISDILEFARHSCRLIQS